MKYSRQKLGSFLSYGAVIALSIALSFTLIAFMGDESRITTFQGPEILKKDTQLTTIYRDKTVYEDAFFQAGHSAQNSQNSVAVITSHHLLAAPLIARSYASVRNDIKRVILVSPDHFHNQFPGSKIAFTTLSKWDGIFSDVLSDSEFIDRISSKTESLEMKDGPFLSEHGIYTEIPFIAHYFPDAMLAPVILKNDYNYSAFRNFGALLRKESNSSTLLVISSDFSHNTSKKFAKEQDEESLSVLKDLPNSDFDKLNNDCRACIALLAGFLDHTEYSFQLTENKDSTDFGGEDSNVTSYVSGYFTQNEGLLDETPVTMLFGGDMQFDRYIRSVTTKRGGAFVFDGLRSELQKADLVVTNLEGPITDSTSVSETSTEGSHDNYVFTFPPETAALLKRENIRLVNIGNNHILNFREDGVRQTQGSLEAAGVESFGSPLEGDTRYVIRDIRGTRIAFVNYNQFVSRGRKKALEDIAAVKERSDFLVVYTHWGKEYVEATPEMKELAHTFVDAGADLIIGSHPHVVQESEIYRGKAIYYSLGNLIFDQYFRPETQTGFLVRATFDLADKEITTEAVPIFLRSNGQTEIAPSDLK